MLLRERWSAKRIQAALNWLRRENACGAHIYIRPCGTHALSLVDDLSADSLRQMRESSFGPALIVETSPTIFRRGSTMVESSIAHRAPRQPRSWRGASVAILPALIGVILDDSRGSAIKSPRDGWKTDLRRSYGYAHATDGFTPQQEIFWRKFACWSRRLRPNATRGDPAGHAPPRVQFGRLRLSVQIPGTGATFIGQKWHGLYTPQGAASQRDKSGTKYFMDATFQKKADPRDSSPMPSGPLPKQLARFTKPIERGLGYGWCAGKTSPHERECLSPFLSASPDEMRCAVAPLQARRPYGRFALSRLSVSGGSGLRATLQSGLEGCARRNGAGSRRTAFALAFDKRAHKGDIAMDECVMCKRKVDVAENWIKCHLWGGFAIFHWRCFGEYLRAESEERVESVVWSASSLTKTS